MNRILLSTIIFITGASVMILELAGARVLAPYVGTSIFVWTSLIGVILGCLSLGYFLGGRVADKKQNFFILFLFLFLSALWIGLVVWVKDPLLYGLAEFPFNIQIKSFIAAIVLFSVPNILLGMAVPYIVRMQISDVSTTGRTVGNLYALSTLGSIFGTFFAGYFLIPFLGSSRILLSVSLCLFGCSLGVLFVQGIGHRRKMYVFITLFMLFAVFLGLIFVRSFERKFAGHKVPIVDVETSYNRVWIYDSTDSRGDLIKIMRINNEGNSAEYLFKDGLVADYLKVFRLAEHFVPKFQKTLMLGGAGCSYAKYYLKHFKQASIDVVEIDPTLTKLARKYFGLKKDSRLKNIHEDGRIFLNQTKKTYDVVLVDAFNSLSAVPFQLTTKQAVAKMHGLLNPEGAVFVNMISAIKGDKGMFARAEFATYRSVFPRVYLLQVDPEKKIDQVQNVMLIALKSEQMPLWESFNPVYNDYLKNLVKEEEIPMDIPILTDAHAPVEYYMGKALIAAEPL